MKKIMHSEPVIREIIRIDSENPKCNYEDEIARISEELDRGKLIIYPTETVYGLGVDFQNDSAMKRLCDVKGRETSKQISVIAADTQMALQYIEKPKTSASMLMEMFWPGPLTIVFPANKEYFSKKSEKSFTLGIRVPGNSFCRNLAEKFGRPITATSANFSGEKESISIDQIHQDVVNSVDIIIDGGELLSRIPSTVISVVNDYPVILREGAIPRNKIEECLGNGLVK